LSPRFNLVQIDRSINDIKVTTKERALIGA